jgi:acylphosphatase
MPPRRSPKPSTPTPRRRQTISHTRRYLVLGKVQGVFFRQSTRLEAQRLAIRGFARNLPDGSVEVLAHGTPEAVQALRQWLGKGPSFARVDEVREAALNDDSPLPADFETR